MPQFKLVEYVNGNPAPIPPDVCPPLDQIGPPSFPGPSVRPAQPDDERPSVVANHEEHRVVKEAIYILSQQKNVYQKGNSLVRVQRKQETDQIGEEVDTVRFAGTPQIREIRLAKLRSMLSEYAEWLTPYKNNDGDWVFKQIRPPDWAVQGVHADDEWKGIPEMNAIVECPIMRPDGSFVTESGYDPTTGVVYQPNDNFHFLPETVSREEALESLNEIAEIIDEFPFASIDGNPRIYKGAWLAALLTPFARFAINGPCPLFLFDANMAGSGKSLLCDIISAIITGRDMSRTVYPANDEEMRKRITSIALSGDLMMLIDNISTQFGGQSLDAVLTSTVWKDRILGASQMSPELPMYTVWYGTGNNIFLKGDIQRRIIPCTLDCDEEKPQDRTFTYDDILGHVKSNRSKYVLCCMKILRAFIQAGKPRGVSSPVGSYPAWSDMIRSCVYWITGEDCLAAQDEYRDMHDSYIEQKESLFSGLAELPGATSEAGVTVSYILTKVKEYEEVRSTACKGLREALKEISGGNDFPTTKQLGNKLKSMNNGVSGGYKLVSIKGARVKSWRIISKNVKPSSAESGYDDLPLKDFDSEVPIERDSLQEN